MMTKVKRGEAQNTVQKRKVNLIENSVLKLEGEGDSKHYDFVNYRARFPFASTSTIAQDPANSNSWCLQRIKMMKRR
jgi:hypothetical protein